MEADQLFIDALEENDVKHVLMAVAAIHPNPHRDFRRNPVLDERVDALVESIQRTGFWENVVVRPHPERPGEYQLAYGHSRLKAAKKAGITEARLPVADLSDWQMYCQMVDENETQQQVTPAIAFENVEVGVELLERAFREIGPEGTEADLNKRLGRGYVSADTYPRDGGNYSFEKVRKAFFAGEGIGRNFVIATLPSGKKMRTNVVSEVLNTHYGQQREEAKRKKAEAKAREAAAKRAKAQAEKDEEEAARLRAEAEADDAEAEQLEAEARRIGGRSIDQAILLLFENPNQMTDFAEAVKKAGIPKNRHKEAADFVRSEEYFGKQMAVEVEKWWYQASGQAAADIARSKKDKAFARFRKSVKDGDFWSFMHALAGKIKAVNSDIDKALTAAEYAPDSGRVSSRANTCKLLNQLIDKAVDLRDALTGAPHDIPNGNGRLNKPEPKRLGVNR